MERKDKRQKPARLQKCLLFLLQDLSSPKWNSDATLAALLSCGRFVPFVGHGIPRRPIVLEYLMHNFYEIHRQISFWWYSIGNMSEMVSCFNFNCMCSFKALDARWPRSSRDSGRFFCPMRLILCICKDVTEVFHLWVCNSSCIQHFSLRYGVVWYRLWPWTWITKCFLSIHQVTSTMCSGKRNSILALLFQISVSYLTSDWPSFDGTWFDGSVDVRKGFMGSFPWRHVEVCDGIYIAELICDIWPIYHSAVRSWYGLLLVCNGCRFFVEILLLEKGTLWWVQTMTRATTLSLPTHVLKRRYVLFSFGQMTRSWLTMNVSAWDLCYWTASAMWCLNAEGAELCSSISCPSQYSVMWSRCTKDWIPVERDWFAQKS